MSGTIAIKESVAMSLSLEYMCLQKAVVWGSEALAYEGGMVLVSSLLIASL